jgi:hypothetical protein
MSARKTSGGNFRNFKGLDKDGGHNSLAGAFLHEQVQEAGFH